MDNPGTWTWIAIVFLGFAGGLYDFREARRARTVERGYAFTTPNRRTYATTAYYTSMADLGVQLIYIVLGGWALFVPTPRSQPLTLYLVAVTVGLILAELLLVVRIVGRVVSRRRMQARNRAAYQRLAQQRKDQAK